MAADYTALKTAWGTTGLPSGVTGTALASGMTPQQKLAAINGWTVAGPRLKASRGDVRQTFDLMVNASGVPAWEAIEANQTGSAGLNIACRAALRLRDAPGDYPPIDCTDALLQGQLAALVAGSVLTQAQMDQITALSPVTTIAWCEANGYPFSGLNGNLNMNDVAAAGLN